MKKINLITILMLTLLLTGCAKDDEIYTIEPSTTEVTQDSETESIEKILENSKSTIDVSEKYNGVDMSDLFLKNYSEEKSNNLSEIINPDKKTIILITSPYCGSCDNINYTDILTLESDVNVIIATFKEYENSSKFEEKGIYNSVYTLDDSKLVSAYNDNQKQLQSDYSSIITSMGLPSCIFINSDGTFSFGVNGLKTTKEIKQYLNYLE